LDYKNSNLAEPGKSNDFLKMGQQNQRFPTEFYASFLEEGYLVIRGRGARANMSERY